MANLSVIRGYLTLGYRVGSWESGIGSFGNEVSAESSQRENFIELPRVFPEGRKTFAKNPIPDSRFPIPVAKSTSHFPLPSLKPLPTPNLSDIASSIAECRKCGLCEGRTHTVPGEGVENPRVLVVGEGPGADEDESGRPFVGRAGQLLDKMLEAINLSRDKNCFIANIVKCRPPGNRDPSPEEQAACAPYLVRQILALQPEAILCVGRVAAQNLLATEETIGRLRGRFFTWKDSAGRAIPLLATFHPSYLLRDPSQKRTAWEDLKLLRDKLAVCRAFI